MKFKKGDIIITKATEPWQTEADRLVFKLYTDARYDYYNDLRGKLSSEKTWWASGRHVKGKYAGTYVRTFHINNCTLYDPLGIKREVKEHKL